MSRLCCNLCTKRKNYVALVEALYAGGANENYLLARLAEYLVELIAEYEAKVKIPPEATGVEVLRYLMQRDNLRQVDLPELGSRGAVSELLSGWRDFNARQAKALAARFGVSAAIFFVIIKYYATQYFPIQQ